MLLSFFIDLLVFKRVEFYILIFVMMLKVLVSLLLLFYALAIFYAYEAMRPLHHLNFTLLLNFSINPSPPHLSPFPPIPPLPKHSIPNQQLNLIPPLKKFLHIIILIIITININIIFVCIGYLI